MAAERTILVAGSRNVDAGKTTFATGLVADLGAIGLKPRAGNDYWYDYDTVARSLEEGRLVGKDARRLAAASAATVEPEGINPLHRLWRPLEHGSGPIFGREGSEFLVDRVGGEYVVNGRTEIPRDLREGLDLGDAAAVESLSAMNEVMYDRHQPAMEGVRPIVETRERVVVESYADVARPIQGIEVDAVAVVGAGSVSVYDGDRYCRAAEVASGNADLGRLEERVDDVVDLLEPRATVSLPPLTSEERSDPASVAAAYDDAYEALLDIPAAV